MTERTNIRALSAAYGRVKRARRDYHALVEKAFREGQKVMYLHGLNERWATVRERQHGSGCVGFGNVWVIGNSGRGYWLDAARIKEIIE